jgi:hypothetical protein
VNVTHLGHAIYDQPAEQADYAFMQDFRTYREKGINERSSWKDDVRSNANVVGPDALIRDSLPALFWLIEHAGTERETDALRRLADILLTTRSRREDEGLDQVVGAATYASASSEAFCSPSTRSCRRHPGRTCRCSSKGRSVGTAGFEPAASCSQSRRATRLRHVPQLGLSVRLPAAARRRQDDARDDHRHARELHRRRRFVQEDDSEEDRERGLERERDGGEGGREARQRGCDQEPADHLGGEREQDEPGVLGPRRPELELAQRGADGERDERRRERRVEERAGRPPQVRASRAKNEQEAGVRDRREDPEDNAQRGVRAVRARADDAGDEDDAEEDDGTEATVRAAGFSLRSAQAASGTITTWTLPSTVARPAPTAAIAWCQKTRSAVRWTPATSESRRAPRSSGPKRRRSHQTSRASGGNA